MINICDKWIGQFDFKLMVDMLKDDFSLTYDMCKKNGYFLIFSWMIFTRLYYNENNKIIGIAIFDTRTPKHFHIYSFEIKKNYQLKGHGTKFIKTFIDNCKEVTLSSLPESKIFYQKIGFDEREENQMVYRRD